MESNMTIENDTEISAIAEALARPFDAGEVKFKPQSISGNRALAVAYVDARVVLDRLDSVLGVMAWQDSYECLPDGAVVCTLKIRINGEWIQKVDVGGQSEQPDEGDRRKAAFSDALKRCAVKWGIGRYIYRLKPQWCDYDLQKKQFVQTPTIPTPQTHVPGAKSTTGIAAGDAAHRQARRNVATDRPSLQVLRQAALDSDKGLEDADTITPEMAAYITALAKSRGYSEAKLAEWGRADEVGQMSVANYRIGVQSFVKPTKPDGRAWPAPAH
jgi:hypothetical protein